MTGNLARWWFNSISIFIDSKSESCETLDDDEEKEKEVDDDEILIFDDTNAGTSISVENNGRKASRDVDSFCNGVVFSKVYVLLQFIQILVMILQTSLRVGVMYSMEVTCGGDWSGSLRR